MCEVTDDSIYCVCKISLLLNYISFFFNLLLNVVFVAAIML